jgi:hypothetical protein
MHNHFKKTLKDFIYSLVPCSTCFGHCCAHHQEPFLHCTRSLCSPCDVRFDVASSLVQVLLRFSARTENLTKTWTRLEATSNRTSHGEQRLRVQWRKGSWWWAQQYPKHVEQCTSEYIKTFIVFKVIVRLVGVLSHFNYLEDTRNHKPKT